MTPEQIKEANRLLTLMEVLKPFFSAVERARKGDADRALGFALDGGEVINVVRTLEPKSSAQLTYAFCSAAEAFKDRLKVILLSLGVEDDFA